MSLPFPWAPHAEAISGTAEDRGQLGRDSSTELLRTHANGDHHAENRSTDLFDRDRDNDVTATMRNLIPMLVLPRVAPCRGETRVTSAGLTNSNETARPAKS
jgi:hypothetical protein